MSVHATQYIDVFVYAFPSTDPQPKNNSKHSITCFMYTGFDTIHNLPLPEELVPPQEAQYGILIGREYTKGGPLPYSRSHPLPPLEFNKLASMQLSYFISRCDSNKHIYEIVHVPRAKDGHTKQTELAQLGEVLEGICAVNGDKPPIATSQDFHGSHLWIMMAFLGLLHPSRTHGLPFFHYCTVKTLDKIIPFFIYGVLFYRQNQPVFNQGDKISNGLEGGHIESNRFVDARVFPP